MSKLEVDKIDPQSGTDLELGTSGDTITIPTGVTLDASNATTTLPATVVTTDGSQTLTNKLIDASQLTGTITPSDGTVTNAKIVDSTIQLAKLSATGTKDATTFLRGDNTFAEAGGGSLIKLASTTITTGVSSVAFNNTYITSTYDNYKLIGYGLSTSADNQDIGMLMSVDNGSNFATHLSARTYLQLADASGNLAYEGNNNYISLGSDEEGDNSGGINFDITIYNINSTTQYKYVTGMVTSKNQNGLYYGYSIWGLIQSNTAVNYLKVFTNVGGNLDAGTITLYGLEK